MMKLFGTDGIRGKAGEFPITPENIFKLGFLFAKLSKFKNIAVAWDTRESSLWIANSLISGLELGGAKACILGCIPTPALSFSIRENFDGGIMITASHNPFFDNGLKFFNGEGDKINDSMENAITKELENLNITVSIIEKISTLLFLKKDYLSSYFQNIHSKINLEIIKCTYPIDCANGATSLFTKYATAELNLKLNLYNSTPDGKNINLNCGAANPEYIKSGSFAFDGDGDRIMGKDLNGNIINGDIILMFLADTLKLKKLVGTIMTNKAVEEFCKQRGIMFKRTKVGDRFVKEKMNKTDAKLGGETSGHIIFTELNNTGDGFAIYLKLIELLNSLGITMNELTKRYKLYPQKVVNIKVKEKIPFDLITGFNEMIKKCEQIIGEKGRIFPRYSGTENLLRILIECEEQRKIEESEKIIYKFFNNMED